MNNFRDGSCGKFSRLAFGLASNRALEKGGVSNEAYGDIGYSALENSLLDLKLYFFPF
jgi:hypothetical protein